MGKITALLYGEQPLYNVQSQESSQAGECHMRKASVWLAWGLLGSQTGFKLTILLPHSLNYFL